MASLEFTGVSKSYDGPVRVIDKLDMNVGDGEFVVFVGPSGCGKSTLLRMIAGIEDITGGTLRIDGQRANELPAARRGVAMVFQSYALYPHMTVQENMAFALKMAKRPQVEIDAAVKRAAEVLGITALLQRKPGALSGGQRQRVAIGRAIVRNPKVFLFDEPLSNLDASLRVQMRVELARMHQALGTTMIYVTHDQVEAMTLGDRIAVFNEGRLEQIGTPRELYDRPVNRFVAQFLGSPAINFLPCQLTRGADGGRQVALASGERLALGDSDLLTGGHAPIELGVRAEHWQLCGEGEGLKARVDLVEYLGDVVIVHASLASGHAVTVKLTSEVACPEASTLIHLKPQPGRAQWFDQGGRTLQ
ncbi:MAG TPA: sn-glycerol-3-phosphate ABC transporter ATP-binding protein UgpC [Ideonella sp.]|uniref:ABC transporter ATP-binding protein n=1 Tax=Ideonella sp. TaxID=1929293 RepID=UPI002C8A4089|nr:sn-glycerol-3-phosphate ABC transporter ATP-binding protein UgpC [Ideonella sp.]HSI50514.1 sn-glycerol-3-phosphate ABC transporter ATP-binding protein UgpC [Ideonella sp.]